MTTNKISHREKKLHTNTILFVVAIIFFASTLRTPLTGVGPIISFIRDSLGISNVLAGFLTTIPLLAFAFVSPFVPRISRKFGMEWTLFYSIILLTIGIILRSVGSTSLLIIGTVLIGVAIAFGNVLFPSFFKMKFPFHIGLLTGIYTVSMNISAAVALGISNPIAANSNVGWQGALAGPIVLTLITLITWIPLLRGEKVDLNNISKNGTTKSESTKLWKSPLAWAIAVSMGLQSLIFYCSAAWLPEILISQGFSADKAGWMTSVMQMSQIPMTFLIPIIAEKLRSQRPIVILFTSFYIVGFFGVFFEFTNFTILWMILIGLGGGASFGTVVMLFTLRTKTAYEAAQISGFAQSIGYLLAAIGPVLFGFLHDMANSWYVPNGLFIIVSIVLCISAYISAKDRYL
ncbi:CynX/NimT family MFS transporter [Ureibacillus sp. 179-F W5.1 NHS]|uniref:MFS transporter n=1 Tax=Lysinibacillus halotolerans TaxID=1368476 RepID=A0A3M8H0Q4_9BACI|nr:MFS transporter [Lysinibacillus halotolerans]RNC95430.1 MFS transporter [Lysinibacillus halotolerans]